MSCTRIKRPSVIPSLASFICAFQGSGWIPAPGSLGPNSMVELLHPKALVTSLLLLPKFLITGFPSIFVLLSKLKPWNVSSLKVLT